MVAMIIKTTIYTEDRTEICHHKMKQNSYKYNPLAPSTQRIRDKNTEKTNFVPSSIYHNFLPKTIIYMYTSGVPRGGLGVFKPPPEIPKF